MATDPELWYLAQGIDSLKERKENHESFTHGIGGGLRFWIGIDVWSRRGSKRRGWGWSGRRGQDASGTGAQEGAGSRGRRQAAHHLLWRSSGRLRIAGGRNGRHVGRPGTSCQICLRDQRRHWSLARSG